MTSGTGAWQPQCKNDRRFTFGKQPDKHAFNTQVLQKLGSVMAAAPIGICFTREHRFELVSAEFCRMFGRAEHELLGKAPQMIYASNADYPTSGPKVRPGFRTRRAL